MSDVPPPPPADDDDAEERASLLDRARGTGVGVEDPNIVGDVGPTDVAPGEDPDGSGDGDPLLEVGDDPGQV